MFEILIGLVAPRLKLLVAGFLPRRPVFAPGSSQVGFVADKVALGYVFCSQAAGAGTIVQKWASCRVDLLYYTPPPICE
jgi:hypothetical protein